MHTHGGASNLHGTMTVNNLKCARCASKTRSENVSWRLKVDKTACAVFQAHSKQMYQRAETDTGTTNVVC